MATQGNFDMVRYLNSLEKIRITSQACGGLSNSHGDTTRCALCCIFGLLFLSEASIQQAQHYLASVCSRLDATTRIV